MTNGNLKVLAVSAAVVVSLQAGETVLELPPPGEALTVTVNPAGEARWVVRTTVPIAGIQEVWTSELAAPSQARKWSICRETAPQSGMPFIAFFNTAGSNAFSFGSASLEYDNALVSKINQEKGVFELALTVASEPDASLRPFAVTLDRRPVSWTRALGEWRGSLPYLAGKFPDGAWKPVYCSWYAVHADVTQEWTERTARIAADLGFKTFILDDGWSYDERKRVNPETLKTWYRNVGKWDAFSKAKFPDFPAHRRRMRELGLKYLVWTAPFFVGTDAPAYRRLGLDRSGQKPFEGNVLIDVADRAQTDEVIGQLVRLLRDSDLDGLKIDFLDYIAPSVEKPRGVRTLAFTEELMRRLREVKPDGLFEFRESYATPLTAHLATQFRAGDVPFEWLDNLRRIAQIRITMGDRVPIHADPICWSRYETADNIERHFMAAMAGVPMLSMDLERLSEAERATVRRWMDFYVRRVEPFQREGAWEVRYRNGGVAAVTSIRGDEAIAIVNDPGVIGKIQTALENRRTTVLNLTYEELTFGRRRVAPASVSETVPGG